ncbi:MAG: hypothetical protein V7606_5018 [Burkholderiales bacterium]
MQKLHKHQRLLLFVKCRGQKARERKRILYRRQLESHEPSP